MAISTEDQKIADLFKERITTWDCFSKPLHESMRKFYKLYRGTIFCDSEAIEREFYYDCKLIYSLVQGFIPSIIISDPDIILKPRKESSVDITNVCEIVINYYWRELNIKDQMKKALLDTFVYGFGVVKTGWQTKIAYGKKKLNESDPAIPNSFEVDEYVKVDAPIMRRVSPYLFMWDPQARTLDSARWVGEKIVKPREEVLNNKAYNKEALESLEGSHVGVQDLIFADGISGRMEGLDPDKYVMLYELHDRERGLLITMADGCDTPLRVIDYPYSDLEGTHYGMLVLHPMPDRVEGISLCDLVQDQQITLNRIRILQSEAAKRAARHYAIDPEADIDDKQIQSLQNAEHASIIRVPVNAIKPIDHASLPQELFIMGDIAAQDMLRVVGSPPSRIGQAAGGRTSATEINVMQSVEQYRLEDAKAIVSDFCARMTKKMFQIMANKLTDEKVIMIAGEDNFVPFKFTKDQLTGEFDFIIEPESMARANRDVERQQLMNFLNMAAKIPTVNQDEIVKRIAKSYGWKDLDKLFQAPPPPPPPIGMPPMGGPPGGVLDTGVMNSPNPPDQASMQANIGVEGMRNG